MALSLFRWLFVIARHSSFTYRGRTVDVKQVGRELGVRYVLEGSVRKAGNRIRIAGQLIDTETRAHLWAGRFEGDLEDLFDLQDRVTESVVGAIAPKLQIEEIRRANRKPTENLTAYDYYLRGLAKDRPGSLDANQEALRLYCKAIEVDPKLACAYGMAAWCHVQRKVRGWMVDHVQESAEATRLARKAVHLGHDDPVALCMGGYALAFIAHEFDAAAAFMDREWQSIRTMRWPGHLARGCGFGEASRSWRLNMSRMPCALIHSTPRARTAPRHMLISCRATTTPRHPAPNRPCVTIQFSCCQYAYMQRARPLLHSLKRARKGVDLALKYNPGLRISNLRDLAAFRRDEDFATFRRRPAKSRPPGVKNPRGRQPRGLVTDRFKARFSFPSRSRPAPGRAPARSLSRSAIRADTRHCFP